MVFAAVGLILLLLAVLAFVVGATGLVVKRAGRREQVVDRHDDEQSLRYAVPPGGDPAVAVAALESEGFVAVLDPTGWFVSIAVPPGASREDARAIIARANDGEHAAVPGSQPVVFEDER